MTKYKYYFKKPKGEIVKDILDCLLAAGAITVVATSPYFLTNILRAMFSNDRYKKKSVETAFYRLRKEGCIKIKRRGHQIYVSLTDDGRKKAGWMQINHLAIKKPNKWDAIWRIIIFDIANEHRVKREAFRGFIKRLGCYPLQKSVWVHPYDCRDEIELLRSFFSFDDKELRIVEAKRISDDRELKNFFGL